MIETIALAVCEHQEIGGIGTQNFEYKLILYADDAVFVLRAPVNSLKALIGI